MATLTLGQAAGRHNQIVRHLQKRVLRFTASLCVFVTSIFVCNLERLCSQTGQPPSGTAATGTAPANANTNDLPEGLNLGEQPNRSWSTYDISEYTTSVKSVPNPEKNILDWILRETGTQTWFGETIGVLSVGRHSVRCYHDSEVQRKVRSVVDRFVKTSKQDEVFGFQVLTIGNPNWRAKLGQLLARVETQTPGVQAWTTAKENAAQIFNELRKRGDFYHPISQTLITESGQPKTIIRQQPLNYFRSIIFDNQRFPPFRVDTAVIQEGYSIQLSPLRSLDGKLMDAEIFCEVRQVEQFRPVNIDVPGPGGTIQKHPISVPQFSNWRLKERFQWPSDKVLIISAGVVAAPDRKMKPNRGIQDVFEPNRRQADVLILVDCKGLFPRGQAPKSDRKSVV